MKRARLAILFSACVVAGAAAPVAGQSVMLQYVNGNGGSVTCSPACGCLSYCGRMPLGTVITLTAVPKPGYSFVGWDYGCSGTTLSCSYTAGYVSAAVKAVFLNQTDPTYPLTIRLLPALGAVVSAAAGINCNPQGTCTYDLPVNSTVTLSAVPASGYKFIEWGDDCSDTAPTCTLIMNSAKSAAAQSYPPASGPTLTVQVNGPGTVYNGWGTCTTTCTTPLSANGSDITAAANQGAIFTGWSGACSGTAYECMMDGASSKTVTANFSIDTTSVYPFDVTVSGNGSVTSQPAAIDCHTLCTAYFAAGTTVTLKATPASGQVFSSWSGACSGNGACIVKTGAAATAVTAQFNPVSGITPDAGYWWNANQPGRGYVIETRGGKIFMAAFLYDQSGRSTWYGAGPAPVTASTFSAPMAAYTGGQTLTGNYQPANLGASPGNINIAFSDTANGILSWPGGSLAITRYPFATNGLTSPPTATQPQTGWWWNPGEGGRGFSIEVQNNTAFVSAYMYDGSGSPLWYASGPAPLTGNNTYQGTWTSYAGGTTLTGPFQQLKSTTDAGSLTLQFSSSVTGTLTLPNGRQIAIQRYAF